MTPTTGPFGRLAMQCPLTGYEANNILEVISAEHTPANPTSRRSSFCSTFNSFEEVDDTCIERLDSPQLEQKREASVIFARVYHFQREKLHVTLTTPKYRETCVETHKRRSSRDRKSSQERQLADEGTRAERREVRDFPIFREGEALHAEQEARC